MRKLLLVVAMGTNVCLAQTTPSLIKNDTSPIRLISNLATATDMMAGVTIENVAGRKVTNVSLGLIVTIPQQCNVRSFVSKERVHSFDVSLAAGESTTLNDLHLSPIGMNRLIHRLHAQDVLSQLAIVGVTFGDGTSWHFNRTARVYDTKLMNITIDARCGSSQMKTMTADGLPLCKGRLLLAKQGGSNGQYHTCVTGPQQICSVSATNTASCTNTVCPTNGECPGQMCQMNQASSPVPAPAPPSGSGGSGDGCDDNDYWCDGDDGSGDGGDGAATVESLLSVPPLLSGWLSEGRNFPVEQP